ncbi:MAG: hypothetical protein ACLTV2_05495 [Acutalibacter sp.]
MLEKLPDEVLVRHQLWFGDVPFLFLSAGFHHVPLRGDPGSFRVFVTTSRKREVRAMKIVIIDKRKGFVGMVLRRIYGVRKIEEV